MLIGNPKQRQPISLILSNPVNQLINQLIKIFNFIKIYFLNQAEFINCKQNEFCIQLKVLYLKQLHICQTQFTVCATLLSRKNFNQFISYINQLHKCNINFNNYIFIKNQIIQQKNLLEGQIIQGDLDTEQFYLFRNDSPIQLQFISIRNYTQKQYVLFQKIYFYIIKQLINYPLIQVGNGVFNLQNGNQNSIFLQGYLQKKFISPLFQFNRGNNLDGLKINYNFARDSSFPALKTYSDNIWDVQMVGISLGGQNMEAIAHYRTFIIQTYVYSAIPKKIAKYLKNKYNENFDNEDDAYVLLDCFQCNCEKNFPNLEIFTTEYKITIPIEEFTFTNTQGQCEINISQSNLLFGIRQILLNNVIFDPLQSELQFPEAEQMQHPSITYFQIILIQSNVCIAILLALLIQYERVSTDLQLETKQFDIKKYIELQNIVKQVKQIKEQAK
ncbi:transmembrane protein, putative (macronuclear) [Tetrahymena thermophila SB210]|uniref:Transmembrane protein, putative n=1 Tax=Tetrahymena thermophila (strain SB210) TaxID=312017 RepID=W7XE20_TETTS|nr:transmembrane protein, putative [Tetrahymena thermophila SB210]EWS75882.1 transmembrane protein, putative [Tetrahymena thermophila SB210]|eukprot:XP_012651585.1 transmembrane protein, putative [Tetrahymena thermophila SB210]